MLVKLKMAETMKQAVTMVEQGHVRVGPKTILDPSYHITRSLEDYVTWTDGSVYQRKIQKYNDKVLLLGECVHLFVVG